MNPHRIARIAALVGEPARTAMLLALMDGRALTARELALAGGIGAATASRHLALLVDAGLLAVQAQGRHRYHRLASAEVARALEALMQVSATQPPPRAVATGPRDEALRLVRSCYDHLAGRLAVVITEHLLAERAIAFDGDAAQPLDRLAPLLDRLGLPAGSIEPPARRALCRPCLDWSERRPHLAGRLGALICGHCLERGWLLRRTGSRALQLTPRGGLALRDWMGTEAWRRVVEPDGGR